MRHHRAIILLAAAIGLAALTVGTAFAAAPRKLAFKGTYAGKVTEQVVDQTITALTAGTGTGTLVGKGKLAGTVTATTANPPCSPLAGSGTIAGPKGKLKIKVVSPSRGCAAGEDDPDNISASGSVKVTGGTLLFKKAKGTLRFTGHYDRKSGAFNVTLKGSLTY